MSEKYEYNIGVNIQHPIVDRLNTLQDLLLDVADNYMGYDTEGDPQRDTDLIEDNVINAIHVAIDDAVRALMGKDGDGLGKLDVSKIHRRQEIDEIWDGNVHKIPQYVRELITSSPFYSMGKWINPNNNEKGKENE